MYTITKRFKDFPAAHRQHNHDGHCAYVHGHNWSFEMTFAATTLDENGFVMDFGKMKFIKDWLTRMFDHTLLINKDDPFLDHFVNHSIQDGNPIDGLLWDITIVPNGSAEDLAAFVFREVSDRLYHIQEQDTDLRVHLVSVTVYEDDKNSATYKPKT